MKYITLIKLPEDVYDIEQCIDPMESHPLGWVYTILEADNMYFPTLLEWLEDKNEKWLGGNTCNYEKINGKISVTDDWEEKSESSSPNDSFTMKKEDFKDMIEQWMEKVLYKRPPRVIIYWEDGKVRIETQTNWLAYIKNFFYNLWHRWKMRQLNKKK